VNERPAAHVFAGLLVAVVALVTFLAGRQPVSVFVAAVAVVAYAELRRILSPNGRVPTLFIGAAAVAVFMWVAYDGRLSRLAWGSAGAVIAALVLWVAMHEATGRSEGATDDIGSTLTAAGVVGVLGAHVLLVRAVPRFGFGGTLALGLMVFLNDAFAFFGGRVFGHRKIAPHISPGKTLEGALCGFAASVVVGVVVGASFDPPFTVRSGVAFGVGVGVVAPMGDLVFSSLKRSAGVKNSGRIFGPMGGALDTIDSLLFAAPLFYWAFRTIAL
jgi:phosphatidate cytidylyltransferase